MLLLIISFDITAWFFSLFFTKGRLTILTIVELKEVGFISLPTLYFQQFLNLIEVSNPLLSYQMIINVQLFIISAFLQLKLDFSLITNFSFSIIQLLPLTPIPQAGMNNFYFKFSFKVFQPFIKPCVLINPELAYLFLFNKVLINHQIYQSQIIFSSLIYEPIILLIRFMYQGQ